VQPGRIIFILAIPAVLGINTCSPALGVFLFRQQGLEKPLRREQGGTEWRKGIIRVPVQLDDEVMSSGKVHKGLIRDETTTVMRGETRCAE